MLLEHLSVSRSSKTHSATDTGHKFFPRMTVPHELQLFVVPSCWSFVDQGMAWLLGAARVARALEAVSLIFSFGCHDF